MITTPTGEILRTKEEILRYVELRNSRLDNGERWMLLRYFPWDDVVHLIPDRDDWSQSAFGRIELDENELRVLFRSLF